MQNQSIALAKSTGFLPTLIELKPKLLPRLFPNKLSGKYNISLSDKDNLLIMSDPDIVFSCGRRMAGISIGLKRLFFKKNKNLITVHIQNPKLPSNLFDFLIVPKHDNFSGKNILISNGSLTEISEDIIKKSFESLQKQYKEICNNHIAVLVGGDTKDGKVNYNSSNSFVKELKRIKNLLNLNLVLTFSRRTPKPLLESLKIFNVLKSTETKNPYPGLLKNAKLIIVTSDSVNMISEALSSGIPVLIYDLFHQRGRKHTFIQNLIKNKFTNYSYNLKFKKQINQMKYKPLNESNRIGKILQKKLLTKY